MNRADLDADLELVRATSEARSGDEYVSPMLALAAAQARARLYADYEISWSARFGAFVVAQLREDTR